MDPQLDIFLADEIRFALDSLRPIFHGQEVALGYQLETEDKAWIASKQTPYTYAEIMACLEKFNK